MSVKDTVHFKADAVFTKKYFILPKSEIAYIRFILESYDGLAFVRTLNTDEALIEIAYPPSRKVDAEQLLLTLQKKAGMTETDIPAEGYVPL